MLIKNQQPYLGWGKASGLQTCYFNIFVFTTLLQGSISERCPGISSSVRPWFPKQMPLCHELLITKLSHTICEASRPYIQANWGGLGVNSAPGWHQIWNEWMLQLLNPCLVGFAFSRLESYSCPASPSFRMPGHPHRDATPGVRTPIREGSVDVSLGIRRTSPGLYHCYCSCQALWVKVLIFWEDRKRLGFVEDLEVFTHGVHYLGWLSPSATDGEAQNNSYVLSHVMEARSLQQRHAVLQGSLGRVCSLQRSHWTQPRWWPSNFPSL